MAQETVYPLVPTFVVVALGSSTILLGTVEGLLAVGVILARLGSARALDRDLAAAAAHHFLRRLADL
jgi:hypothetical protein